MKKKIYSGITLLAIAAAAAGNVSLGSKSTGLSDVSLANVEALAEENESNIDLPGKFNSYTNGSCTITLPNGSKRQGTWHDCNRGNNLCIQACVAN